MAAPVPPAGYPVRFRVDAADAPLNRWTTAFRIIVAIPILIVLGLLSGDSITWTVDGQPQSVAAAGGLLFAAPLLLILFRQKYPRWWFDWNVGLWCFGNRVAVYLFLLRDEYPSTDEEQAVHLEVDYPDVPRELNRWLPLVKWFLAIPHAFVLFFLWIAVFVVTVVAWFAVLFTGRYPQGIFDFVVGVLRWHNRVLGYAFVLSTDRYPPFSLDA